ncbi:MAG: glycosyltransferase family 39 protein [Anaerolineae bacterium]
MHLGDQVSRCGARAAWPIPSSRVCLLLLVVLLLLASGLNIYRAVQPAMSGDEGRYAYAAWRISQGEVPYKDFLTPQMPVFLYLGGLAMRLFDHSLVAVRLLTTLAMLAAACLLYAVNKELFDPPVALLSAAIFLTDANILHNGRFFRSEAYMLVFALAGLYGFVLAEKRGHLRYAWLAGVFFGLSIGSKLFGFLPLGACFLYLLYAWWRERRPFRHVLRSALALGIPALVITVAIAAIFTRLTPYFFTAIFEHHTMQHAELTLLQRARNALRLYRTSAAAQPLMAALTLGGVFLVLRHQKALPSWPVWHLPTVVSFVVLSRPLYQRHLTYLVPEAATLVALVVLWLWRRTTRLRAVAVILGVAVIVWSLRADFNSDDVVQDDSAAPQAYIQQLSASDEQVICDHPVMNFVTRRRGTYWTAGMSGAAVQSGQIRGSALIDDIERGNVAVVVLRTLGQGSQMDDMVDYADFRRYLQTHFALVAKLPDGNRQFEIYARTDTMPVKPDISFHKELTLTGVRLAETVLPGATLDIDTRWQATRQMTHNYHISLRLVDATGHLWTQSDTQLFEQSSRTDRAADREIRTYSPTSAWAPGQVVLQKSQMAIARELPPGQYYLTAKVYDSDSRLVLYAGQAPSGRLPGGDPIISTVQVLPGEALSEVAKLSLAADLAQLTADLALVGAPSLPQNARAGRDLGVTVFWQAGAQPAHDYRIELQLAREGQVVQRWPAEISPGLPTSAWRQGEVVLGTYLLPLAESLPGGSYTLQVQATDGAGRSLGQPGTIVRDLAVAPKPDPAAITAAIGHPLVGLSFGGRIGLLGYDLDNEDVSADEAVRLTLYWGCLEPPDLDYRVFTHLVDGEGQTQGQADSVPDHGNAPTSGWQRGDVLIDRYEIPIKAEGAPGALRVEVGFYDPVTWERLPLLRDGEPSGEDHLVLPVTINVH